MTSVGVNLPNIFSTSGSPVTTSGTIGAILVNEPANTVFAGPNGSTGVPTFRALVGADVPAANLSSTGNGGVTGSLDLTTQASGTLSVTHGGTQSSTGFLSGAALLGNGLNPYQTVSPGSSGTFLGSDGTTWAARTIPVQAFTQVAANLSSTGNSGVTGTLPVPNGGTGLSASGSSGNVLISNGTIWQSSTVPVPTQFTANLASTGPGGVTGTLPIANGGSGQSTANAALNAFLPSQTSNSGKFLQTDGSNTSWQTVTTSSGTAQNYLYNSNFNIWQRYGATLSATVNNGINAYVADRWYTKNGIGTGGVITVSRVGASLSNSNYAYSQKVTSEPPSPTNQFQTFQALETIDTAQFYGSSASFAIKVKALGNINQVGLQFVYNVTETKPTATIGSEQTFSVSSSSYTTCFIDGEALGTIMGTSGVIGIRIQSTGASSGNITDLNNGYILAQGILTKTQTHQAYQPMFSTFAEELSSCQRYFEKSSDFNSDVAVNADEMSLMGIGYAQNTSTLRIISGGFKFNKRNASNTVNIYSYNGTSAAVSLVGDTGTVSITAIGNVSTYGVERIDSSGSFTSGSLYWFGWTSDSEI